MKNLSNKLIVGVLIFGSFLFGDMTRRIYFPIVTTTESVAKLTDNLSLANDSEITIELVDGKKLVRISLEDLQFITKKKKVTRETVKSLEMLFERLKIKVKPNFK